MKLLFYVKTDNSTSTADSTEFCERPDADNATFDGAHGSDQSAAACDDVQQPSGTQSALYFFIIARLMNGLGNSGTTVLSVAYIDENTSKSRSPFYIGIAMIDIQIGVISARR